MFATVRAPRPKREAVAEFQCRFRGADGDCVVCCDSVEEMREHTQSHEGKKLHTGEYVGLSSCT